MSLLRELVMNQVVNGYEIFSNVELDSSDADTLISAINNSEKNVQAKVLGGRGVSSRTELNNHGSVVVKHFRRGGLFRYLVGKAYFRSGKTRPEIEYELLNDAKSKGIKVPNPLAYITKGRFFYKGWLVTQEIKNERNLAEISLEDESRARNLTIMLVEQIAKLIKHKIFHVDLHPGNVLVTPNDEIFLIDFDKATFFKGTRNKLRDMYLCRWRRAVIKHNLPEMLSELVCAGIRRNFD